MPPGETKEVFIPIAVTKQEGLLEVTVRMSSQLAWDEESLEIEVKVIKLPFFNPFTTNEEEIKLFKLSLLLLLKLKRVNFVGDLTLITGQYIFL